MRNLLSMMVAVLLGACATVDAYLNGSYNSAVFPALDAPPETIAMVSQADGESTGVLSAVDGAPILINPRGNGDGLWAKQVALQPGQHAVLTGWRLPGRYSPDALLCSAAFAAGHGYRVAYDVTSPQQARAWITDAATGDRIADCRAQPSTTSSGWPFSR